MTKHTVIHHLETLQSGETKKVTITALNYYESIRYSLDLKLDIPCGARLIITQDGVRHLMNSGHLTGVGRHHRTDTNHLSDADLSALPKIFKSPDVIKIVGKSRFGLRIKVEKQLANHHRLILELEKHHKYFRLISFFNINK